MRQIVGRNCVICHERIPSTIDGQFCPTCGCPIHNRCRATAVASPDSGVCKTRSASATDITDNAAGAEKDAREQANRGSPQELVPVDTPPGEATKREVRAFGSLGIGCVWSIGGLIYILDRLGGPNLG